MYAQILHIKENILFTKPALSVMMLSRFLRFLIIRIHNKILSLYSA